MKHPLAAAGAVMLLFTAGAPAAYAQSARDLYTRALAQERNVRDAANGATLTQMRHVVAAYESVVRRHPASGYSDNALWQAGNLAALAYQRFGNDADRKTAARLFQLLAREYPASTLAAQAKTALSDLTASAAPSVSPPPGTTPAPASAPVTPAPGSDRESSAAGSPGMATSRGKTPRSDLAIPALPAASDS